MNDLIVKYFDGTLSAEESAELSSLLARDSDAAREFACLARSDLVIERHFAAAEKAATLDVVEKVTRREMTGGEPLTMAFAFPSTGRFVAWGAVAAVLALLGLVVALLLRDSDGVAVDSDQMVAWNLPKPPIVPGGGGIRLADGLNREEKRAAARLRARLGQFYLPSVTIRGMTLDGALTAIEQAMDKSDHRGWLRENPLTFTIVEHNDEGSRVRLVRENLSVINALELLAIQAGKQLVFSSRGIEMSDFVEDPDALLATRAFDLDADDLMGVSPYIKPQYFAVGSFGGASDLDIAPEVVEFEGFVNYGSEITFADGSLLSGSRLDAPASGGSFSVLPSDPQRQVLADSKIIDPIFSTRTAHSNPAPLLEMWGVSLDDGASAEWIQDAGMEGEQTSSELVVTARNGTMDRIATLLSAASGELAPSAVVTIETKVFEVPEAMALDDALLDASSLDVFMNEANNSKESTIIAAPSVMTRNAQHAKIEVITEMAVSTGVDEVILDHTGIVLDVAPAFDGELVRVRGSVDLGFVPEQPDVDLFPEASRIHPDSPVVHQAIEFDAFVGPGEAAVFSMPGTEPGKVVIYVIEANR